MNEIKAGGTVESYSFVPEDLGMKRGCPDELRPLEDRRQEALRLLDLLRGRDHSSRLDIVCLNAGLLLYLMDQAGDIGAGLQQAREIIFSGRAIAKLEDWMREQTLDTRGVTAVDGERPRM